MIADNDYIINLKLTNNGCHVHRLTGDDKDVYSAYRDAGGLHMQSPHDTHYVMDGAYIIFIGNKTELLSFVHNQF